MRTKTGEKRTVTISLDVEVHEKLKKIAADNHTTMSQWITDRVVAVAEATKEEDMGRYFG